MIRTTSAVRPGPCAAFAALILSLSLALPVGAADLEGHWEGSIELPGQALEISVDLAPAADGWEGSIDIPAQGTKDLPLEGFAVDGSEVTFAISGVPGEPTFSGTLSDDGSTLAGELTQGGQSFPFTLTSGAPPAERARQALEGLDERIETALAEMNVPGLGLAVVVDGEVVLSRGYGVRDVELGEPVTGDTLFAIGSATKAFTTFVLATLVDEGVLAWDDPVADHLPGFRLSDEYASAHLTVRDMVTHRSGMPRHDLVWYNNQELPREEMVRRLRHLPFNRELREAWQYNNLMYITAGYLAGQLAGGTWEEAVRARILGPLGMERTNFSVQASREDPDHALPYRENEEQEIERIDFRPLDLAGPAGSINSSVAEMARWLLVNLEGGRHGGEELLQETTLRELHTPQMVMGGLPTEPELSPSSYAMGWVVRSEEGHLRLGHGGNIDGFSALVTLYPNDGIGIVALANKNASALPGTVTEAVADRIFGRGGEDAFEQAKQSREQVLELQAESRAREEIARVEGTSASRQPEGFIGRYEHPGYGLVEIAPAPTGGPEEAVLSVSFHGISAPLEHWHYDVFNALENPEDDVLEGAKIAFETDLQGLVTGLTAPVEPAVEPILFTRLPPERMSDPAYLDRLTGRYALADQRITVSRRGTILTVHLAGQPSYRLEPEGEDQFKLQGLEGFHVRFTVPEEGPAAEAVFLQPNGNFPAKRVEREGEE